MKKLFLSVLCLVLTTLTANATYVKYVAGRPVTTFGTVRSYTPIGATNYAYPSRFNVPSRVVMPARPALPVLPARPYGYYNNYGTPLSYYGGYRYPATTVVNLGTPTQTEVVTTTTPSRLNSSTGASIPTKTHTINGVTYYN